MRGERFVCVGGGVGGRVRERHLFELFNLCVVFDNYSIHLWHFVSYGRLTSHKFNSIKKVYESTKGDLKGIDTLSGELTFF